MPRHLLETRSDEYLKLVARELLLSEGQNLEQTITLISKKLNINKDKINRFVEHLYRLNLLIKSKGKFGFTPEGLNYLVGLVQSIYFSKNFEGDTHGHTRG
jgi:predicted transcriptional regulator